MKVRKSLLALLVLGLGAGHATAQSIGIGSAVSRIAPSPAARVPDLRDGSVRTIGFSEADASAGQVLTDASLSGNIDQHAEGGKQTIGIAGVRLSEDAPAATIQTHADVSGDITQTQQGVSTSDSQIASFGEVQGSISDSTTTDASMSGNLTQILRTGSNAAAEGKQDFNLAGVRDAAGTATTHGLVSSSVLQSQTSTAGGTQKIQVGSIESAGALTLTTQGTVTGNLTQSSSNGGSRNQELAVGAVTGSAAQSIATEGLVAGNLTQDADGSGSAASQSVRVGSVIDLDGSGAQVTTQGSITGDVFQQNHGSGGSGVQQIDVASVSGSARGTIDTHGSVGAVTQANNGTGFGHSQKLAVGSVSNSTADHVVTQADVTGPVTQTIGGIGDGSRQSIAVGSVDNAEGGLIATQSLVTGAISQRIGGTNSGTRQKISIASVEGGNAAQVTTQVVVEGDISQTALALKSPDVASFQTISLGSVHNVTGNILATNVAIGGSIRQDSNGSRGAPSQKVIIGSIGTP